jgi:hypothetical protein
MSNYLGVDPNSLRSIVRQWMPGGYEWPANDTALFPMPAGMNNQSHANQNYTLSGRPDLQSMTDAGLLQHHHYTARQHMGKQGDYTPSPENDRSIATGNRELEEQRMHLASRGITSPYEDDWHVLTWPPGEHVPWEEAGKRAMAMDPMTDFGYRQPSVNANEPPRGMSTPPRVPEPEQPRTRDLSHDKLFKPTNDNEPQDTE